MDKGTMIEDVPSIKRDFSLFCLRPISLNPLLNRLLPIPAEEQSIIQAAGHGNRARDAVSVSGSISITFGLPLRTGQRWSESVDIVRLLHLHAHDFSTGRKEGQ